MWNPNIRLLAVNSRLAMKLDRRHFSFLALRKVAAYGDFIINSPISLVRYHRVLPWGPAGYTRWCGARYTS